MDEPAPRQLGKDVIYEGRKLRLELHRIEAPDGRRTTREVVVHPGAVAVLALRCGNGGRREVLMERNYRYSVGRYLTEIPAGTLDKPGESLEECATRELQEETGYRAGRLRRLVSALPSPGFLTERLTLFVAEDVVEGSATPEPGELIRAAWMPWDEAMAMIRRGEIEDGKTIVAMLYYERFGQEA